MNLINLIFRIEFLNDNEPVFVVRDLPAGARYGYIFR